MTSDVHLRPLRAAIVTIALLSAALFAFQLLLQRVCAVRLGESHGTWVLAMALLGGGAAGAVLTLCERSWRLLPDAWVRRCSLLFLLSVPLSHAWLLYAPVPATLGFDSIGGALQLLGVQLAGAVPFGLGGAAVALLVSTNAGRAHAVLGAALMGAAVCCAFAPAMLWHVGAGGTLLVTMVLAAGAGAASAPMDVVPRTALLLGSACAGFCLHGADAALPVPGRAMTARDTGGEELELSPVAAFARWSGTARVEVMTATALPAALPAGETAAAPIGNPALATGVADQPAAPRWWLAHGDGCGGWLGAEGGAADAAFDLLRGSTPAVCLLGVGAGVTLRGAVRSDATSIRAVEADRGVIEVQQLAASRWPSAPIADRRVTVVCDAPRSALMRSDRRFDAIVRWDEALPAADGDARDLLADTDYSVEACRTMYDRLADNGVLQLSRTADAAETIRLLHNLFRALPEVERPALSSALCVLRSGAGDRVTVLLKKGPFTPEQGKRLAAFAAANDLVAVVDPVEDLRADVQRRHDAIVAVEQQLQRIDHEIGVRNDGVDDKELQRLRRERAVALQPLPRMRSEHDVAAFVLAADKDEFAAGYPFDVRPTTDDRPFFLHLGSATVPVPGGATRREVGAGLVHGYLGLGTLLALLLVALPLLFRGGAVSSTRHGALRLGVYAGAVALGFVGVAAALMQKFALLLGPPEYSPAVTLTALLLAAGLGSMLSQGALRWEPQRLRWMAIVLFLLAGVIAFTSPTIVDLCIGLSPAWRAIVVAIVVVPVGLLLGMPLAHGLRVAEDTNPGLVPWFWTVTASASAIGTLLASELALGFGFAAVLFAAGAVFLVAMFAIDGLARAAAAGMATAVEGDYVDGVEAEAS